MTKIASRSQLPRTTVDAIVRRLLKQGLITREKIRGHVEYEMKPEEVADKLDWIEQRLRPQAENATNDENIVISEKYMDAVRKEMKMHEGERVKLMFSHNGDDRKESVSRLISYIGFAVEDKCKFEVLLSTTIADNLRDREVEVTLPRDANAVRLNVVPASYGSTDFDMLIFRDCILLVNPTKKTAELVRHTTVVEMSKHLLGVACETGWSINLTAWLNEN